MPIVALTVNNLLILVYAVLIGLELYRFQQLRRLAVVDPKQAYHLLKHR